MELKVLDKREGRRESRNRGWREKNIEETKIKDGADQHGLDKLQVARDFIAGE